jgi:hypothetical protein
MLDTPDIDAIVERAARDHLGADNYVRSYSRPGVDSTGEEVVSVTLVIAPGAVERIGGDRALDFLYEVQQTLARSGDQRFPLLEYATEQELLDDAGERHGEHA